MRKTACVLWSVALTFPALATATAATIPVSYLVQEKSFKALAPAGTMITLELYPNSVCSGLPAATASVDVEALTVKERIKTLKPKGSALKPLKLVELRHVFSGVSPSAGADLSVKV